MPRDPELADVLGQFVQRSGYSAGQLERLCGIPKRTIANWLAGRVRRPRHTADLLKLARALHLDEEETDALLHAAHHPPLQELRAAPPDEATRDFLAQTTPPDRQRAPFQAIPDLPYFVGRQKETQALRDVLVGGGRALICSLQGMGGVGKTALAAHLAYHLRPDFPDGVLWARVDKADPMAILSAFAGAYGRDVSAHTDVDSRSQVVREILADRQALIILDNVQSSEEVEPLLPPSAGRCAVLITTRNQHLAITSGTHRFTVGPFDETGEEAMALFTQILGQERVRQESAALSAIARLLGHLPLAIAIAASRMAYEPGWSAPDFLRRLQQEKERLDLLRYEDQSVRLSARVSYDTLQPEEQALFAALAAFSPDNVNVEALAAVADRPPQAVEHTLRRLYGLSLAQVGQGGRYCLHPLLHDFAREQLRHSGRREAVLGRMVDFYAGYVNRRRRDYEALEQELENILAAVEIARDREMHAAAVRTVTGLHDFLETKGHYELAAAHLDHAEQAAHALADDAALARVLLHRARLCRLRDDFTAAKEAAEEGLALAQEGGEQRLTSALFGELGAAFGNMGQRSAARTHFRQGLALARELGDPEITSKHLLYLGTNHHHQNPQEAEAYYKEGLTLARQIGDAPRIAKFLNNLALLVGRQGVLDEAETYLQESLALGQELEYQELTGIALINLSKLAQERANDASSPEETASSPEEASSHLEEASTYLEEALAVARRLGQARLLRIVHEELGELALAQEQYEAAATSFQEALSVARKSENKIATSSLLRKQAQILAHLGDESAVEAHFRESLALARQETGSYAQATLLNEWGELLRQTGRLEAAATAYTAALAHARQGGDAQALEEAKNGLDKTS